MSRLTVTGMDAVRAEVDTLARIAGVKLAAEGRMGNPLLDLWSASSSDDLDAWTLASLRRSASAPVFAWAVPDDGALDLIAKHWPTGVIEVGAGTGYWARQLADRGVDVAAYDLHPMGCGCDDDWCHGNDPDGRMRKQARWHDVAKGGPEAAALHPDRTLLLCWPPYSEPVGAEAVRAFHEAGGTTVAYVGEGPGGCTGDDKMHQLLGEDIWCSPCDHVEDCDGGEGCWAEEDHDHDPSGCTLDALFSRVTEISVPQWWGIHDRLTIYRRRP